MFNSLFGRITDKHAGALYLETAGIEWDIAMPVPSLLSLPPVGESVRVYTYLYHREDQVRLFGFASSAERALFFELLKVDGVGPRQAIKVLSGLPFDLLLHALEQGDVDALSRAPGLGKKTAQKIVLALRGKLVLEEQKERSAFDEIVEALVEMGFDRKLAAEAVRTTAEELGVEGLGRENEQELLRRSIVRLST